MLPRHHPDGVRIAFDDHRLVVNAGLILPATLALGLPQLVQQRLDLGNAPGRATPWTGNRRMSPPSPCSRREGRGMAGPGRCQDSLPSVSDRYPRLRGFRESTLVSPLSARSIPAPLGTRRRLRSPGSSVPLVRGVARWSVPDARPRGVQRRFFVDDLQLVVELDHVLVRRLVGAVGMLSLVFLLPFRILVPVIEVLIQLDSVPVIHLFPCCHSLIPCGFSRSLSIVLATNPF